MKGDGEAGGRPGRPGRPGGHRASGEDLAGPGRLAGRLTYAAFSDQSLAAGIRFAVSQGAQVINMSLSGTAPGAGRCDTAIQDAVAYALDHDVVVVAGAGNVLPLLGEQTNEPKQPASCAGVLAVSAVNPNLTWWRHSERQPYVAVSAPGNEIQTLGLDGQNFVDGYGRASRARSWPARPRWCAPGTRPCPGTRSCSGSSIPRCRGERCPTTASATGSCGSTRRLTRSTTRSRPAHPTRCTRRSWTG